MTSLFSYLLTFLAIIFWAFRAIATLLYQLEVDFFTKPLNETYEIIVLFATLPCLILVVKRNIVGAAAYLGLYVAYFGNAIYKTLMGAQEFGFTIANSTDMLITTFGVLVALLTFFDVLFNKHRTLGKGTKKGDWFYTNEAFDREFDERADRNQYKI